MRNLCDSISAQTGLCLLFFAPFFIPITAFCQLSTASLNGIVRDSGGAVVPGATIRLRNIDTSVETRTATNGAGAYAISSITPGKYTVQATDAGFELMEVPEFELTVGQAAMIDFSLKVGTQNTQVIVKGEAPLLETSTADLGSVILTQAVNDIPLNGRNFTQLLSITPGVVPISTGQNSGGGYAGPLPAIGSAFIIPAINGQTNRSNLFLTDGLNNFGSVLSTYAVPPIIDAIQEFKVMSHTDSAEYGGVMGGVVNVVTKSGVNDYHGSAWEYARNTIFDARSYFLPHDVPTTPYSQNQFGGSGGGPFRIPRLYNGRDKTFFFAAYQGFRYSQTSNALLKVPTAAELAGDESDWPTQIFNPFSTRPDPNNQGQYLRDPFPNNQIPQQLIDQRMVAYADFVFPKAGPVFDSNGDNAIDPTPVTQTQNEWTVRIDHTINSSNSIWFRYSFINNTEHASGGLPGLPSVTSAPGREWGGSYVHVFSPNLVLEFQSGRTTLAHDTAARFTKSTADIFSRAGFSTAFAGGFHAANDGNLIPSPGIENYANGGESINEIPDVTDSTEAAANLTGLIGRHTIHIGFGYITNRFSNPAAVPSLTFAAQQTGDTKPTDTANSGSPLASFILNVPNGALRQNLNEQTRTGGVFDVFAQDSWRASANLTLNFGIRYDLTLIPQYGTYATIGENGGIETGDFDFTNGTYILMKEPPPCSVRGRAPCIPGGSLPEHVVVSSNEKIAQNTYANVGPRLGFAYRIGSKNVVRGAYGIIYDNWAGVSQTAQNFSGSWPDVGQFLANNLNQPSSASATPTVQAQDPFAGDGSSLLPAPTPFNQVNWFFDPHLKNPYSLQWSFGIEHEIDSSTTVTLNYVGSSGKRLDVGGYYNTALTPGPGDPQSRSLYPYIAPTYWDHAVGSSNYNAFQFSLQRRFINGVSYSVAYTWSKSINVGSDGWFGAEGGVPQDPYNPAAFGSRAVAGTDLPNVLSATLLYQVPFGAGKRFSIGNRAIDYLIGNWQVNGIFTTYSGQPFTPVVSSDIANTGNGGTYEHADIVGNPNAISKRTPAEWFNTSAYAVPQGYTYGTAGRNSLRSQAYWDLDSSLFRAFPIGEKERFEFRAEAFNLFNNVVLGVPISDLNSGASFGTINTTSNTARELQLGVKFIF
jgi:hypothetical protein